VPPFPLLPPASAPPGAGVDLPERAAPGDFASLQFTRPFVVDDGAARSLHFTWGTLQSRLLTHSPWELALDYTRSMMGFLLFNRAPAHIGMVGLGGGSLARFCHRFLPGSRMTVLEINPHVIALREQFQVPSDGARFQVIAADGARYLATQAPCCDVLLIDGFNEDGQPAALCSQRFYDDCHSALAPGGVLVVNLQHDHPDHPLLLGRIDRSFGGNALDIPTPDRSNSIVFARRGAPMPPRGLSLGASLAGLAPEARRQLRPELARLLGQMSGLQDEETGRAS